MAESVREYTVRAEWDRDAGVWVAESDDVPGLVTEAETFEGLEAKLRVLIPELLEANGVLSGQPGSEVLVHVITRRDERIALRA